MSSTAPRRVPGASGEKVTVAEQLPADWLPLQELRTENGEVQLKSANLVDGLRADADALPRRRRSSISSVSESTLDSALVWPRYRAAR